VLLIIGNFSRTLKHWKKICENAFRGKLVFSTFLQCHPSR